jgi:hypothetical protein
MSTRKTRKNTPPLIENTSSSNNNYDEVHNVPLGIEAAAAAAAAAASAASAAEEEPILGKRSRESPDPSVVEELQSVAALKEPSRQDIENAIENITSSSTSSTSSMPSLESGTDSASAAADKVYELDKSIVDFLAQQHVSKTAAEKIGKYSAKKLAAMTARQLFNISRELGKDIADVFVSNIKKGLKSKKFKIYYLSTKKRFVRLWRDDNQFLKGLGVSQEKQKINNFVEINTEIQAKEKLLWEVLHKIPLEVTVENILYLIGKTQHTRDLKLAGAISIDSVKRINYIVEELFESYYKMLDREPVINEKSKFLFFVELMCEENPSYENTEAKYNDIIKNTCKFGKSYSQMTSEERAQATEMGRGVPGRDPALHPDYAEFYGNNLNAALKSLYENLEYFKNELDHLKKEKSLWERLTTKRETVVQKNLKEAKIKAIFKAIEETIENIREISGYGSSTEKQQKAIKKMRNAKNARDIEKSIANAQIQIGSLQKYVENKQKLNKLKATLSKLKHDIDVIDTLPLHSQDTPDTPPVSRKTAAKKTKYRGGGRGGRKTRRRVR